MTLLEQERHLVNGLPSFWRNYFDDIEFVRTLTAGRLVLQQQIDTSLGEILSGLDRHTLPVFHNVNWVPLRIYASKTVRRGTADYYGGGSVYTTTSPGYYGEFSGEHRYSHPIDSGMVWASTASSGIQVIDGLAVCGVDFTIDAASSSIVFCFDPVQFFSGATAATTYDNNGDVEDSYIVVWLHNVSYDLKYIDRQLGAALRLPGCNSSELYRSFVNNLLDMYCFGATRSGVMSTASAAVGIPMIPAGSVIRKVVDAQDGGKDIISDTAVFHVEPGATPSAERGDVVSADTPASDGLKLLLHTSPASDFADLPGMAVKLGSDYRAEVSFRNSLVDLEVTAVAGAAPEARFTVDGFAEDCARFWDKVSAREASDRCLSEYMDTRTSGSGYPSASNLPKTVNPFLFIMDNVMGNNVAILCVDVSKINGAAPGPRYLSYINRAIPPYTRFIVYVKMALASSSGCGAGGTVTAHGVVDVESGSGAGTASVRAFEAKGPCASRLQMTPADEEGACACGDGEVQYPPDIFNG